ncbi:hypothetical protein [Enterococcus faecalis]
MLAHIHMLVIIPSKLSVSTFIFFK